MKINKSDLIKFTTLAAIACIATTGCSCTTPAGTHSSSSVIGDKSNLDEATRGNHNSLLPPSFYDSNHESEG